MSLAGLCRCEQRRGGDPRTIHGMSTNHARVSLGAVWIGLMGGIGWATGTESITNWVLLGAVAVVPLLLVGSWLAPKRSTSEAIRDALR